MPNACRSADMDPDKIAFIADLRLFTVAVEPAEQNIGIRTGRYEVDFAVGFAFVLQVERADAVGVVGIVTAAPQAAAALAWSTARDIGLLAVTEVVCAGLLEVFEGCAVAGADPA